MTMEAKERFWRRVFTTSGLCTLLCISILLIPATPRTVVASPLSWWRNWCACHSIYLGCGEEPPPIEVGGAWYWLRSPEQEKAVVSGLFNRYCIRCHGIDGRGVWDIPGVPDFTNARWQAAHTDGQLARSILEGRGSVMPPWRGTLSLEEAWAMARYVRTFVPGTEVLRPNYSAPGTPSAAAASSAPPMTLPPPSVQPKTPPSMPPKTPKTPPTP
jgi:hypothetical protein